MTPQSNFTWHTCCNTCTPFHCLSQSKRSPSRYWTHKVTIQPTPLSINLTRCLQSAQAFSFEWHGNDAASLAIQHRIYVSKVPKPLVWLTRGAISLQRCNWGWTGRWPVGLFFQAIYKQLYHALLADRPPARQTLTILGQYLCNLGPPVPLQLFQNLRAYYATETCTCTALVMSDAESKIVDWSASGGIIEILGVFLDTRTFLVITVSLE